MNLADPIHMTACNIPESPEEREAPTALLCVDEDELDDWWLNLDVEQKADAFTAHCLRNQVESHIYIEMSPSAQRQSTALPIAGTVEFATDEKLRAAAADGDAATDGAGQAVGL